METRGMNARIRSLREQSVTTQAHIDMERAKYFTEIYRQSLETWKNQGRMSADITGYIGRILLCGLGYSLGILLEIYCNPKVMEFLMKNISIF